MAGPVHPYGEYNMGLTASSSHSHSQRTTRASLCVCVCVCCVSVYVRACVCVCASARERVCVNTNKFIYKFYDCQSLTRIKNYIFITITLQMKGFPCW